MAEEFALTVELPEFDEAAAYNLDRPISSLIRTQLLHLHAAENMILPADKRTNININHLLTEGQASEYIHKVTALLHEYGKKAKRKAARGRKARKPRPAAPKVRTAGQAPDQT